eukprot:TRINITY_DN139_c7_g1_i1.p1 TRINITY_DN139_c7_g1~~TRINITY_DN139_c7_g1_i1.p1  ORF type:complete len:193 (+),score=74.57 TRINITY_DN139_c7_g1_i1:42-581(+)
MSLKRSSDVANTEAVDVVQDISKKMDEFVNAVAMLKDLEEKPDRIKDSIKKAELDKHQRMDEFDKKLSAHQLRTVQSVLEKQNKVAVDVEEYAELQALQIRDGQEIRSAKKQKTVSTIEQKVDIEMQLNTLKYAKKFAEAAAKEASFKTEKSMLYRTIQTLRDEIESQKKLTSELALTK